MPASPPAQPVPRARAEHLGPERRRPLILDVAFELFLEHGYRGTSMDATGDGGARATPVIYACFSGKAELFGSLLDREEQPVLEHFSAALATSTDLQNLKATLSAGLDR